MRLHVLEIVVAHQCVSDSSGVENHCSGGTLEVSFASELEFAHVQEVSAVSSSLQEVTGECVQGLQGHQPLIVSQSKEPQHFVLVQRVFKAPIFFFYPDIRSFWNMHMVLLTLQGETRDSFQQEGEISGTTGGRAPNVETLGR